jgi:Ser/Thr protein kinase RdoA (MazF antagonist)
MVERCKAEVPGELPQMKKRTAKIADRMLHELAGRGSADWVPSHGDFHPMNVFLADNGRVTVIDFDTFSARERASDVAYFLAQSAIMGYLDKGTFKSTSQVRTAFLSEYQRVARCEFDKARLGLYIAFAFLQSLHFERCILHTGNSSIVDPWLRSAERCLDGDIEL